MSVNTTPEHSHLTEQEHEQEQQTQEPYVPKWDYEPEKIVLPTIGRIVHLFSGHKTKPLVGIVCDVDGYSIIVAAFNDLGESMGGLIAVPHATHRQDDSYWWWDWPQRQE